MGVALLMMTAVVDSVSVFFLTQSLWCLPKDGSEDFLLPAGTLIRDLWRGEDCGDLGFSWRFLASLDGGATWSARQTIWDEGEGSFPVR